MLNNSRQSSEVLNFRQYLQGELVRRCRANPRYSLRAFARHLGVGPAFLSMMLSEKRGITKRTISRLSERIGLSAAQIRAFEEAHALSPREQRRAGFVNMADDEINTISDWCHFAILELTEIKRFRPTIPWIASSLGITVHEASAAVERLIRLRMLEIKPSGRWVASAEFSTNINAARAMPARRTLQVQLLQRAIRAVEEVPLELRDNSSMTMAIDIALLPEAKAKLARFRRSMLRLLQKSNNRDEVYNLSLSLFPLSDVSDRIPRSLK